MWFGIAAGGLIIAEISSVLTLQKLEGSVSSVEDLKGQRIVSIKGTTSEAEVVALSSRFILVDSVPEALSFIDKDLADVFIYDTPVLKNLERNNNSYKVLNIFFAPQDYAFVLQDSSKYLRRVNSTIISIKESKDYRDIQSKWFGDLF
jgi:ABC-type amino acid transport substrate-binding protein